ncbi:tRNA (N(6)-L-threonylcarbamoyladenosine(37)-C(2))-methylthiotransferase [[Eubacterium] cellulosolvens]
MKNSCCIYSENYGCSSNKYDHEVILGQLSEAGYPIEKDINKADIILVNTCAVKRPTEDRIIKRLQVLAQLEKPIIISGCLSKVNPKKIVNMVPSYSALVDPFSIHRITDIVARTMEGEKNKTYYSYYPQDTSTLPRWRSNKYIRIVKISEGCLGDCSYCCTKIARGRLFSFPPQRIIENIKQLSREGAREIYLTSQDTGCYGTERGTDLARLLKKIVELKGDFKVRIGMMTPNSAEKILDCLLDIINNKRFFKFIHIPVQSGSDGVLEAMNRRYSIKEFISICKILKKTNPDLTIATDIIVGYPTETEHDFKETLQLIQTIKPDITNISKYGSRKGTASSALPNLDTNIINRRSKILSNICAKISRESNSRMMGNQVSTYITDKNNKEKLTARTPNYKKILINNKQALIGKKCNIEVVDYTQRYLIGDLKKFS